MSFKDFHNLVPAYLSSLILNMLWLFFNAPGDAQIHHSVSYVHVFICDIPSAWNTFPVNSFFQ